MEVNYGALALIPPVVAIVMALVTKQTILSLAVGVFAGSLIINGWNPLVAFPNMIKDIIIPQMANEWNAGMLVLMAAVGGLVYMIKVSGASKAVGDAASRKIKTRKQAQLLTYFSAFAFVYMEPNLTLGTVMRPITERLKISRVKLAYICDVMGCPFSTLSPITSYSSYATGLIATQLAAIGLLDNPWETFLQSIPWNFYAVFGMLTLLAVILTNLDIGPMFHAEYRAQKYGLLVGEDDNPMDRDDGGESFIPEDQSVGIANFIVPIVVMFAALLAVILWTGDVETNGFLGAFKNANITLAIITGFFLSSLAAGIMGAKAGLFKGTEIVSKFCKGIMLNVDISLILILAWSIGAVTGQMGLKNFLAEFVTTTSFPAGLLPAIIFVIGALVSFSTGSSWGVWSIMMPIGIPMAHAFGLPIPLIIGAVLSGGVLGDHCSPISDTTIMASAAAGADHVEHVRTQLPYALLVGGSSFAGFILSGMVATWLGFIATAICIVLGLNVFSKLARKKEAEYEMKYGKEGVV